MSSLLKSLLFAGLWTASTAESQWCNVASDSTGKNLVAVGYACSKVLISNDFGITWTYTKAPEQYWGSVYSDSTGQHLVIGPHYVSGSASTHQPIMVSNDRGATWTAAPYNNEASNGVVLSTKISGDSAVKKLLTVGENKKLMLSRDGGSSWFGLDSVPYTTYPSSNGYASAIAGNGNVMYAVNDAQEICLSKDAGYTWVRRPATQKNSTQEWRNFVTDSTGQYFFANTYKGFYGSTDYGATLTLIHDHSANGNGALIIDISTDPAAKWVYVLAQDGLWTYTRSSGTFVKNPTLKVVINQGYSAYSVDASDNGQHIIVSVQPEGLYVSDDFGNTWKNIRGLTATA